MSSYSSGWQADAAFKSTKRTNCRQNTNGTADTGCTTLSGELQICGQRQQHERSHLLDSKVFLLQAVPSGILFLMQTVPSRTCACIKPVTSQAGINRGAACSHATCWSLPRQALPQQASGNMVVYVLCSLICQAPGKVAVHGSVGQFTADHAQDLALHGVRMAAPSPVDLTARAPQLQPRLSPVTDLSAPVDSSRLDSCEAVAGTPQSGTYIGWLQVCTGRAAAQHR